MPGPCPTSKTRRPLSRMKRLAGPDGQGETGEIRKHLGGSNAAAESHYPSKSKGIKPPVTPANNGAPPPPITCIVFLKEIE